MNDSLISQSLVASGIPSKNKAENSCWQETEVLWQTDGSVWMQRLSDWSGSIEAHSGGLVPAKEFWSTDGQTAEGTEFKRLEPNAIAWLSGLNAQLRHP